MGSSFAHGCSTHAAPSSQPSQFQPSQIVGLQHEVGCLYAEVVQIIESRQSCWVRPLVLILQSVKNRAYNDGLSGEPEYYDLRQDSDLLLPLTLFQVALDVEVLPWLSTLYANDRGTDGESHDRAQGHQRFQEFIQQIWQAHPEVFQDTSRCGKT